MRQTKGENMVIDHTPAHNLPHLAPFFNGRGGVICFVVMVQMLFSYSLLTAVWACRQLAP